MKRLAGQAGRTIGGLLHWVGMFFITLFLVVAVLLGGLAFRLSRGPLQIPWVTTLLANAVSGQDVEISVGEAALGWAGYKTGGNAPLYLQLGRIAVHNAGGVLLAAIPDARLEVTPAAVFSNQASVYVTSTDARFAGANVPVSLLAGIHLGRGLTFAQADVWVTLGAGALGPPGFAVPLAGAKFLLTLGPKDATLTDGLFTLTPIGGSAPVIRVAGTAHRISFWHGTLNVSGNAVQARDLPHYWPAQAAAPTRGWVTQNITAGTAEAPNFVFALSAPGHLANIRLDDARGSFKAADLTLRWIPQARPITALNGRFTLTDPNDIDIAADSGMLGGIRLQAATLHIAGVAQRNQTGTLHIPIAGRLQDAFAVLNAPPLSLLKTVPAPVLAASGDLSGTVDVVVPFKNNVTMKDIGLRVAAAVNNVTVPLPVAGLDFKHGSFNLSSTTKALRATGQARLTGEPASFNIAVAFGPGNAPASIRFAMTTAITDKTLTRLGLNPNATLKGAVPLAVRVTTTPAMTGRLDVDADLTPAALAVPMFGWAKPQGAAGKFEFAASIEGQNFSGVSRIASIDAQAPGLDIESETVPGGVNFSRIHIGNTEGSGRIGLPATAQAPWRFDFFGNALDVSSAINPPQLVKPEAAVKTTVPRPQAAAQPVAATPPSGILWRATAHFDHLILAKAPASKLGDLDFEGDGQGGSIFNAAATGMLATGAPVTFTIAPVPGSPPGYDEQLKIQTADGGELLRSLGSYSQLAGGTLDFEAIFGTATPLSGTTRLNKFRLLKAPAVAKLLEAITVFGIPDAASGPGMPFRQLVAPFSYDAGVMTLKGARAYAASLGFTASGTIDLNAGIYDIQGTVVPAYAVNALPGKIPLIGKLFSPEKGGGLFAMRYSMTGTTADPKIKVNPLSALTPGFLREIFGLGDKLEGK
jgi:hypothetical protein